MELDPTFLEEAFGVQTDDGVYLDCVLYKPAHALDEELRTIHIWVPRYPLTKNSVIACARHEAGAQGADGRTAHLAFDLRATGRSDGRPGDLSFEKDLEGIRLWARERFGPINLIQLGRPFGQERVDLHPIRPGVVMETYTYIARDDVSHRALKRRPIVYLATYGRFGESDEALCQALVQAGYDVHAIDPLRYLLHASLGERLQAAQLWRDFTTFCGLLSARPIIVAQPVAAGLGLLWASGVGAVNGVIAAGRAQLAFKPGHIFNNDSAHAFFLSRYVHKIAPRPMALVLETGHPLGGSESELDGLYEAAGEPRRYEKTEKLSNQLVLELVDWIGARRSG